MRKIIFILLFIPFLLFSQASNVFTAQDVIINLVLENTFNYLESKNYIVCVIDLKVSNTNF